MSESKEYLVQQQENGNILISQEVVASVAALAVREVEGVYGLSMTAGFDISEILGKKNLRGKIKFTGVSSETGFFVDGKTKISVGSTLSVYILNPMTGDGAAVEITIDSIEANA